MKVDFDKPLSIDKSSFIEVWEKSGNAHVLMLRPHGFGKSMFTELLDNYYDHSKSSEFQKNYGNTYIAGHPTRNKSNYRVLRISFGNLRGCAIDKFQEEFSKDVCEGIQNFMKKNPDLEDKDEVARIVGVGAVIFNDLYNQRIKDVSFRWEKLLNFDGETGPYVQYTYARCSSILRKAYESSDSSAFSAIDLANIDYSVLTDEASVDLLKEIIRFPEVVKDASEKYEPSIVARFAVDVAQAFNKFYTVNRINIDDEAVKNARLALVKITRKTLRDALDLLGIGVVEQM